MNRRGFALLAVLWLITAVTALALAATLAAREATATARYRMQHTRAAWRAEACTEHARLRLDRLIADSVPWAELGIRFTSSNPTTLGCEIRFAPAGSGLNVNLARRDQLVRLIQSLGMKPGSADSAADAILDWRDDDNMARLYGAEVDWYQAHGLVPPRNGLFAAPAELLLVRGMAGVPLGDSLLIVDESRIPINLAPLVVVGSLPGIGPEIVAALSERRRRSEWVLDLAQLGEGISRVARDSLLVHFAELAEVATIRPAWLLTAAAVAGEPPAKATVELRLAPAAWRVGIARRREW